MHNITKKIKVFIIIHQNVITCSVTNTTNCWPPRPVISRTLSTIQSFSNKKNQVLNIIFTQEKINWLQMAFHLKKHAALSVNLSGFCSVFPEIECRCHCGILLFLNGLVKRSNRPHKISSLNIVIKANTTNVCLCTTPNVSLLWNSLCALNQFYMQPLRTSWTRPNWNGKCRKNMQSSCIRPHW